MTPFRIGIIGGMGPLAGVQLHRLIIQATPASVDQDHLQVLLFTDPTIPDRTTSLRQDDGRRFAAGVIRAAKILEQTQVNIITIACMTAHSRLNLIRQAIQTPILDGIELTQNHLQANYPAQPIALLATEGSINSGVYTRHTLQEINWLLPDATDQISINQVIYGIKAGQLEPAVASLTPVLNNLRARGACAFVLGCTELGLLYLPLTARNWPVIDPLQLIAQHLVQLGSTHKTLTPNPSHASLTP